MFDEEGLFYSGNGRTFTVRACAVLSGSFQSHVDRNQQCCVSVCVCVCGAEGQRCLNHGVSDFIVLDPEPRSRPVLEGSGAFKTRAGEQMS